MKQCFFSSYLFSFSVFFLFLIRYKNKQYPSNNHWFLQKVCSACIGVVLSSVAGVAQLLILDPREEVEAKEGKEVLILVCILCATIANVNYKNK